MVWACVKIRWALQHHITRNGAEEEIGRQYHWIDQKELHNPDTCPQPRQVEPVAAALVTASSLRPGELWYQWTEQWTSPLAWPPHFRVLQIYYTHKKLWYYIRLFTTFKNYRTLTMPLNTMQKMPEILYRRNKTCWAVAFQNYTIIYTEMSRCLRRPHRILFYS